ncbi:hypothetical protein PhCBS80983_g03870 [Powellomyces hirtus]|uniref:L-2-hydroxyglutarate dehydrogenase, mitochondrial n=1 Tax=Powellomyces hirtus TaxID=109895 RepID=A0A507E279_9FUNG|nr:hypothetical protein PhCBS80983_g03870 [Powellomyces hirtus]
MPYGRKGLAIAERLSRKCPSTLVIERNAAFGMETSSRNSEVIHAGIYYPPKSLKTRLCIRGNRLLYSFCERHNIPHSRVGKWIVASSDQQIPYLHDLTDRATSLGVPAEFLPLDQAAMLEPNVIAKAVLASPSTGIIDSHAFMAKLESMILSRGADIVYRTPVEVITRFRSGGYQVLLGGTSADAVSARRVFNCAGLFADEIAGSLNPALARKIYPCKGIYYSYTGHPPLVKRLIYPVPEKNLKGLGTHATVDLAGKVKFGPDATYVESKEDLVIVEDDAVKESFVRAIGGYLKGIDEEKLSIDYAGMRPKLSGPGQPFEDFVIEIPKEHPGFVNLMGIESPGLTASLAIAEYVEELVESESQ